MTYQQKFTIASLATILVSFISYSYFAIRQYRLLELTTENDLKFCAKSFLHLIAFMFVCQVICFVIFYLLSKNSDESIRMDDDEMDKTILRRVDAISFHMFSISLLVSVALILFDLPICAMFVSLSIGIFITSLTATTIKLVLCLRGY